MIAGQGLIGKVISDGHGMVIPAVLIGIGLMFVPSKFDMAVEPVRLSDVIESAADTVRPAARAAAPVETSH